MPTPDETAAPPQPLGEAEGAPSPGGSAAALPPPPDADLAAPSPRAWIRANASPGPGPRSQIDAAFERGEELVGVAVIGLALTHPDPTAILPRVARALDRALESSDPRLRHQGIVALAHTARLHRTVDRRCLDLLRRCPRGSEADDDLWAYVPRRRLPWWLWRHRLGEPPRRWLRRVGKALSGARGGG
ncbi:hypothetical protein ACH4LK_19590 [Streptomyces lydicus]|uniref:hypothetical protein n=1 Tax=Streptomyces lydicus TaxID=47763 RepID=UPI0037AEF4C0